MKKVLVTGGSGFIGSQCLKLLSACNDYEIHVVHHGSKVKGPANVIRHKADLLYPGTAFSLLSEIKPSHLLHLAWYAVPEKFWASAENFKWVSASLSLIQAFAEYGGERCVLAGSCAEYDWKYGYCSEFITPRSPSTVYGVCKNSLQLLLEAFSKQAGLSSAWGRIFFLYGPNEPYQKLTSSVIQSLLKGRKALCSHGNQIRDFLFVRDIASAFVALLGSNVQGPVNISSGRPVALKEIILSIAERLNGHDLIRFGAISAEKNEPDLLVGRNQRLIEEVGWTPRYNLKSGLDLTIEWWKEHL